MKWSVYALYRCTIPRVFRLGQPRNDEEAEGGLNMCALPSDMVWGGGREGERARGGLVWPTQVLPVPSALTKPVL